MTTPRPKLTAPARVVPEAKVQAVTCVGIDPGLKGGIAWIWPDGTADARPMPIVEYTNGKRGICRDSFAMILALNLDGPLFAAIEHVNAAPMHGRRQGTTSMFTFGREYGVLLGMLHSRDIEHVEVDPRRWKKAILSGTAKDKAAAIEWAQRFHPRVSLLAKPRSRVPSDGMADALCLAEYARQTWKVRQLLNGAKSC